MPEVSTVDDRRGADWLLPGGDGSLFATYSLILATFLGTMGLPHVLVRFYTNPDGASARRTTLVVLGLVGLFYLLPTLYGVLGRIYTPQLLMTGRTDAVVLLLPEAALGGGHLGRLLGALVTAGALAAFLSTSSGPADQRRRGGLHRRPARRPRAARSATSGSPPCWPRSCRWCCRSTSPTWTSPGWSGWRSRWPRRVSARCSCSASGGAG